MAADLILCAEERNESHSLVLFWVEERDEHRSSSATRRATLQQSSFRARVQDDSATSAEKRGLTTRDSMQLLKT